MERVVLALVHIILVVVEVLLKLLFLALLLVAEVAVELTQILLQVLVLEVEDHFLLRVNLAQQIEAAEAVVLARQTWEQQTAQVPLVELVVQEL